VFFIGRHFYLDQKETCIMSNGHPMQIRDQLDNFGQRREIIDATAIQMPAADPAKRDFNEEFARHLAVSIDADTLLIPPIVQALGNGEYMIVDGRHRVHACREILGWPQIACVVLEESDEEWRESIQLATNLLSLPLDTSQLRLAILRLLEVYKKRHPARTLTGRWLHGEGFAKVLETTLGMKPAQAHRLANTAEYIDKEDRDTLEAAPPADEDRRHRPAQGTRGHQDSHQHGR
jgi:hypothetical protein